MELNKNIITEAGATFITLYALHKLLIRLCEIFDVLSITIICIGLIIYGWAIKTKK